MVKKVKILQDLQWKLVRIMILDGSGYKLAAVTAGAEVVHGCVNGLGERNRKCCS